MAGKNDKNDLINLKEQIRRNALCSLYIFYGEEEYLKEHYIKEIENLVGDGGLGDLNRIRIEGTSNYGIYDDALSGMPVMAERRTLVIRDSNIFITRRSQNATPPNEEQKKYWEKIFSQLSRDTVLIFSEKNIDKRSALFKLASKQGTAVDFAYLDEKELVSWAVRRAAKADKKLDTKAAEYLISVIDPGLSVLENELVKLINFSDGTIYKSDIDRVASKSTAVQAFDITAGIIENNAEKVFSVINNMRTQKESPFAILYLIYSNAEKMLRLKLSGARRRDEAAKILGVSPWIAARYLEDSAKFSVSQLTDMTVGAPRADYDIKSGKKSDWQALEDYIFKAMESAKNSK